MPVMAVLAGLLKTTDLVGLAVCKTPYERLKILYTRILDVLGQSPKKMQQIESIQNRLPMRS